MAIRLPYRSDRTYDLAVLQANADSLAADSANAVHALRVFCSHGDIAAATWLVDRFALTVHEVRGPRANSNFALRMTCMNGHLSKAANLVADQICTSMACRQVRAHSRRRPGGRQLRAAVCVQERAPLNSALARRPVRPHGR
jgi:hypothetical protein